MALGHGGGPGRKLGAGPLEAVVVVAKVARVELLEKLVVVGVGRGDEDVRRPGLAKHHGFEGGQAVGVEVLDDLHQRRRVEAGQPLVAVQQRPLNQLDASALARRQLIEMQVGRWPGSALGATHPCLG